MSVAVVCPKCRKRGTVSASLVGQQVDCPKCRAIITVEPPDGDDAGEVQASILSALRGQTQVLHRIRSDLFWLRLSLAVCMLLLFLFGVSVQVK